MQWIAFDIGGANLKVANGDGVAISKKFGLWKEPDNLARELRSLIHQMPVCDSLAVTMTGELADCFATKSAGVRFILDSVKEASAGRNVRVFLSDGRLVAMEIAQELPRLAAASNWRALSDFACRFAPQACAFLIDIGSTTCDIIPLLNGKTVAKGEDDTQRLMCGELIYTGVERSPICGILQSVDYRGTCCGVAQEWFATTRDVYLLLGDLPEDSHDTQTADGRPADKFSARARMGRMICAGDGDFDFKDGLLIAENVSKAQEEMIARGLRKQLSSRDLIPETFILSGQGEFIARRVLKHLNLNGRMVSFVQKLGEHVSRCATAYALAVLAEESDESIGKR